MRVWVTRTQPEAAATAPTYTKEVVRILQQNCQECHRKGQVGPFALDTYEQARKRADDLARGTRRGTRAREKLPAERREGEIAPARYDIVGQRADTLGFDFEI